MKNVIMVTGDKGGCGKSMVARVIGEIMRQEDKGVQLVDGDSANPDLHRFFDSESGDSVYLVDTANKENIMELFNLLDDSPEDTTFILDMPAGAGRYLVGESEMFADFFSQTNVNLEIVWVLNADITGVEQLSDFRDQFKDVDARYTVVRNRMWGDEFKWDESALRKTMKKEKENFIETDFPDFWASILETVGDRSLTRFGNREYNDANYGQAFKIRTFMNQAAKALAHILPDETKPQESKQESS